MKRPKDDYLTPYLTPRAVAFAMLCQQYGSVDAMRAAHPEISDEDCASIMAELAAALTMASSAQSTRRAGKPKRAAATGAAYQIKITLKGSRPPIWRRVVVPAEIGLDQLHVVIQTWRN